MPKHIMFITRGIALIVGLALGHGVAVFGLELPHLVGESGAFLALTWLGIGDFIFAKEHHGKA
jgi:hypothetical protein